MAINITSRVRNAMVGLTLVLSLIFTTTIFLLVYVIEDRVFVNQMNVELAEFDRVKARADPKETQQWRPSNRNIERVNSADKLPPSLTNKIAIEVLHTPGVHEYFDEDKAMFIASLGHSLNGDPHYLVYDVKDLLAVRSSKRTLLVFIGILTLIITVIAVVFARRLSKSTLAPLSRLSAALKYNDLDQVVIDLANEFSNDEVSVLTHELAKALERVRESAKREYEFNRGVSHELRSPIQAAQSATELLDLYCSASDPKLSKPISRLQRAVAEMNEVAEAFLWLASDRIVDGLEMCSIADLELTLSTVQSVFPNHEIFVSYEPSPVHRYPMPKSVLSVVLRNLVRNAAIHGEVSSIQVELNFDRISVVNSVKSDESNISGFGIGLSIVQGICDRFSCVLNTQQTEPNRYSSSIQFNRSAS